MCLLRLFRTCVCLEEEQKVEDDDDDDDDGDDDDDDGFVEFLCFWMTIVESVYV